MTDPDSEAELLPYFSIVVATHNGRATLGRALASLADQSCPADWFEVIVVDDGSVEDITDIVRQFDVRFCRLPQNRGVAAARNAGLDLAVGHVLVSLDDDCIADEHWLACLAWGFEQDDVAGVGGVLVSDRRRAGLAARYLSGKEAGPPPLRSNDPGNPIGRRLKNYFAGGREALSATDDMIEVGELYGANAAIRVDLLRATGGWDETMSGIEDTDLSRRLLLAHPWARFLSVPAAKVAHEPDMTMSRLLKRAYVRGPVRLRYYRRNGFVPPFFPSPFLILLLALAIGDLIGWLPAVVLALLAPQLFYRWWPRRAWTGRSAVPMLFPYFELAEETAIVAGLLSGYTREVPAPERTYSAVNSWLSRTISRARIVVRPSELRAHQQGRAVWLTFDDYGSPEQVYQVLAELAVHRVQAMFFLIGEWSREHPDLLDEIVRAGHVLGNHTYSHRDLLSLSDEEREQELVHGVPGALLRPPMGRYNRSIRALARRHGMDIAYWSVDSDDWQGVSEEYIYDKVMRETRPGSVILFHLHADNTIAVLPRLIQGLRDRNLVLAAPGARRSRLTGPERPAEPVSVVEERPGMPPEEGAGLDRFRPLLNRLVADSLFRNSAFLMASTGIMSGLGFLFWVFVARLYPPADIGVATAVISISVLVSNISMLGLNVGLIRFLPDSRTPNGDINAAFIIVGGVAMVVSTVYCVAGSTVNDKLPFFTANIVHVLFFGVLLTAMALNSLTDSVFIARRVAQYHTIAYTVFGSVRLVLALVLVSAGALGVFLAYSAAGTIALLLSLRYMDTGCDYRFLTRPTFGFVRQTYAFATNNYLGLLLAGLPSQVVPSLILAKLGGADAAYFTMAINIANMLYIVPMAVEQSLLAEGSNEEARAGRDSWRATKILFAVVTPMVVITLLVAPYLLRIFGSQYAHGSAPILQLLALCTIFVGITALGTSMLNVQKRTGWITVIQSGTAVITLAGAYLLLPRGLVGVGLAFLGGAMFSAAAHFAVQLMYSPQRQGRHAESARMRRVELAGSEWR